MTRTLALPLIGAILMGCSVKTAKFVAYSHASARFASEVPEDWTVLENPAGEEPGVQFLAPPTRGRKAVRPYIAMDFHAAKGGRYASLEACIAERTRDLPGRSHGPVTDIKVGPLAGKEFTSMRPLPQSPEFAPKGEQSVRTVLLPAADGFYEIGFAAPQADAAEPAAVFERFLSSFRPSAR
ncbi:MAG: hypothetical protein NTY77_02840 [Elusimicrobia bacterium]|nr:hypothetical protein [Elusimicrobiota bacterium]